MHTASTNHQLCHELYIHGGLTCKTQFCAGIFIAGRQAKCDQGKKESLFPWEGVSVGIVRVEHRPVKNNHFSSMFYQYFILFTHIFHMVGVCQT